MGRDAEIREFLMSRRARVDPVSAGLPRGGGRRVPGLRRGEVAALAGVSVEYYARLERGALGGASPAVLDGLARALQLDDAEREHLRRLAARAGGGRAARSRAPRTPAAWRPSPSLRWFLDSVGSVAMIGNGRTDLLAWNHLGGALMAEMIAGATTSPPNFARYLFLDPGAHRFFPDWRAVAAMNAAQLRAEAGRSPHDPALHELVGELSTRSDAFRELWGRHDVWHLDAGTKRYHHAAVGELVLHFDGLDLAGEDGLQLTVLTAEPGSADDEALRLLGAWAADDAHPPVATL
jgi:transcriptional regulator with XRE-family HTH domain